MQDPRLIENVDIRQREPEPRLGLLEWMEIITQGICPNEAMLEHLLNHIEATS